MHYYAKTTKGFEKCGIALRLPSTLKTLGEKIALGAKKT